MATTIIINRVPEWSINMSFALSWNAYPEIYPEKLEYIVTNSSQYRGWTGYLSYGEITKSYAIPPPVYESGSFGSVIIPFQFIDNSNEIDILSSYYWPNSGLGHQYISQLRWLNELIPLHDWSDISKDGVPLGIIGNDEKFVCKFDFISFDGERQVEELNTDYYVTTTDGLKRYIGADSIQVNSPYFLRTFGDIQWYTGYMTNDILSISDKGDIHGFYPGYIESLEDAGDGGSLYFAENDEESYQRMYEWQGGSHTGVTQVFPESFASRADYSSRTDITYLPDEEYYREQQIKSVAALGDGMYLGSGIDGCMYLSHLFNMNNVRGPWYICFVDTSEIGPEGVNRNPVTLFFDRTKVVDAAAPAGSTSSDLRSPDRPRRVDELAWAPISTMDMAGFFGQNILWTHHSDEVIDREYVSEEDYQTTENESLFSLQPWLEGCPVFPFTNSTIHFNFPHNLFDTTVSNTPLTEREQLRKAEYQNRYGRFANDRNFLITVQDNIGEFERDAEDNLILHPTTGQPIPARPTYTTGVLLDDISQFLTAMSEDIFLWSSYADYGYIATYTGENNIYGSAGFYLIRNNQSYIDYNILNLRGRHLNCNFDTGFISLFVLGTGIDIVQNTYNWWAIYGGFFTNISAKISISLSDKIYKHQSFRRKYGIMGLNINNNYLRVNNLVRPDYFYNRTLLYRDGTRIGQESNGSNMGFINIDHEYYTNAAITTEADNRLLITGDTYVVPHQIPNLDEDGRRTGTWRWEDVIIDSHIPITTNNSPAPNKRWEPLFYRYTFTRFRNEDEALFPRPGQPLFGTLAELIKIGDTNVSDILPAGYHLVTSPLLGGNGLALVKEENGEYIYAGGNNIGFYTSTQNDAYYDPNDDTLNNGVGGYEDPWIKYVVLHVARNGRSLSSSASDMWNLVCPEEFDFMYHVIVDELPNTAGCLDSVMPPLYERYPDVLEYNHNNIQLTVYHNENTMGINQFYSYYHDRPNIEIFSGDIYRNNNPYITTDRQMLCRDSLADGYTPNNYFSRHLISYTNRMPVVEGTRLSTIISLIETDNWQGLSDIKNTNIVLAAQGDVYVDWEGDGWVYRWKSKSPFDIVVDNVPYADARLVYSRNTRLGIIPP